jgi:chorismate dehydratase
MPKKITAVSYLNTYPFVYGIRKSGYLEDIELRLEVPSLCAKSIQNQSADIGLVPSGSLPELQDVSVITDYCIGARGAVYTVLLLSTVPVEQVEKIYLDFDSRTSVQLIKILTTEYWHIHPEWAALKSGEIPDPAFQHSVVAIGDKTFTLRKRYPYVYDLSDIWKKLTGDPFVFAVWVMRNPIEPAVVTMLNKALGFGVSHKLESLHYFRDQLPECGDCLDYLENYISYEFDEDKRRGLKKYLDYLR